MLSVQGVSKSFGGLTAVSGFQLELPTGGLQGLIGPNGAGKTTCFNLLTGIYRPDTGAIVLDGMSIIGKKPYAIAALGLSRTFQNIRLFRDLSAIDNVKVGFHMRAKCSMLGSILRTRAAMSAERQQTDRAGRLLEIFGLSAMANVPASSLPYGDQRRLEIARAIATEPKVLLLDEPAAGMNPHEKTALRDLIAFIRKEFGLSVLLIEHDMGLVMQICERVTVLDHGVVIAAGVPAEVQRDPKVIEAYLGVA